jgi:alkylation response protein AidB-like acyl-CoA dehydrogenase
MLADLEAGMCLAFEAGAAFDAALGDEDRRPWLRLATALAKYWTAKQAVAAAAAAVELIGGDGYTEDWATARLYRDAMVLPVWEGPANIQALEVLRLVTGETQAGAPFAARVDRIVDSVAAGLDAEGTTVRAACARCLEWVRETGAAGHDPPRHALRLMDLMSRTLAGALLLEEAAQDLSTGDNRKALVLRRFLRRHFSAEPPLREDPAQACFDEIVEYRTA